MIDARFGHVNLIARDWRALADFYTTLFACELVPPERDYSGDDLAAGTGVPGAALRGAHLRLPGHGPTGPTLEIYQFAAMPDGLPHAANRPGFQHIAFAVSSVAAAREAFADLPLRTRSALGPLRNGTYPGASGIVVI